MLSRNEQVFNGPVMNLDEKKLERKKKKNTRQTENELLETSLDLTHKKMEEKYMKGEESHLFSGKELEDIIKNKRNLTDTDWALLRNLRYFLAGKIGFEKMASIISKHRAKEMALHHARKLSKNPNYNFRADPREALLAWITNKTLYRQAKELKKKKEGGVA